MLHSLVPQTASEILIAENKNKPQQTETHFSPCTGDELQMKDSESTCCCFCL